MQFLSKRSVTRHVLQKTQKFVPPALHGRSSTLERRNPFNLDASFGVSAETGNNFGGLDVDDSGGYTGVPNYPINPFMQIANAFPHSPIINSWMASAAKKEQQTSVGVRMNLTQPCNREIFPPHLRDSAGRAPVFGLPTSAHIANMQPWQREYLKRAVWPEVDELFAVAQRFYRNTRKRDSVEQFALWLMEHDNELDKCNQGGCYTCSFCSSSHVDREEFRYDLWSHAASQVATPEQMRELIVSQGQGISSASYDLPPPCEFDDSSWAFGNAGWNDSIGFESNLDSSYGYGLGMENVDQLMGTNAMTDFALGPRPYWSSGLDLSSLSSSSSPLVDSDQTMKDMENARIADGFLGSPQPPMMSMNQNGSPMDVDVNDFDGGTGSWITPPFEIPRLSLRSNVMDILDEPKIETSHPMAPLSNNPLDFDRLVAGYGELYLLSRPLQEHWCQIVGAEQMAVKLKQVVCRSYARCRHHYSATMEQNVKKYGPEKQEQCARRLRKKFRNEFADELWFNSQEAAVILQNEYALPNTFVPFLREVTKLMWSFLLTEPMLEVVEASPGEVGDLWPALFSAGSKVHAGQMLGLDSIRTCT